MDNTQVFKLIDSVLSLEVCLYHQVLPLARQEKSLLLGMVDPQDASALNYVRRMLKNVNCTVVPRGISAEAHKSFLSAYLNYKGQTQIQTEPAKASGSATVIQEPPPVAPKMQTSSRPPSIQQVKAQTPVRQRPPAMTAAAKKPATTQPPSDLPVLKVQAFYLSRPIQMLVNLGPQQLIQELLGRVLLEGIGRLYLERHPEYGRVLWTQQGALQSAIENLPLPVFDGLVQEFKQFFNLPYMRVEQATQVEIERLYNKTHLLLLLQVTPGKHGEEVNLQVLRGEALKFYQQQKIADLSQDALKLAMQLQRKLSEIGNRFDSTLTPESLEALPAIDQLVKSMDRQLQALHTSQDDEGVNGEG